MELQFLPLFLFGGFGPWLAEVGSVLSAQILVDPETILVAHISSAEKSLII